MNVYRMTHISNIAQILKCGITHRKSPLASKNYTAIGDVSLISTRNNKAVSVDNGDLFDENAQEIVLGDFIPFYFGVRMPMLLVIQNGGNFVTKKTHPSKIVYMAVSLEKIKESDCEFYFSDGHATDNLTTFYDSNHIGKIDEILSWRAIKAKYWGGSDNLNTKRKKQAELLLRDDIPPSFIDKFGCYNKAAKQKLINLGIHSGIIKVIPQCYY